MAEKAILALGESASGTVLDLCAGTLDLTRMLLDTNAIHVHAADFSQQMLDIGEQPNSRVSPTPFTVPTRESSPLKTAAWTAICGFGLRNARLPVALAECARPRLGPIGCAGLFQPVGLVPRLAGTYNRIIVPIVGGFITGAGDAYRYLNESIDAFHTADEFVQMLAEVGLKADAKPMFPRGPPCGGEHAKMTSSHRVGSGSNPNRPR